MRMANELSETSGASIAGAGYKKDGYGIELIVNWVADLWSTMVT